MRHAFSVDVEGFSESMAQSVAVPAPLLEPAFAAREIEENMVETLDFLAQHGVSATFFILGRIARDHPHLVRTMAQAGHEIASHSYDHLRLHRLDARAAKEQLSRSKKTLEDTCGYAVRGFRAPDFSITPGSLWLVDALQEAGYRYDSSFFPIGGHDVYGMPGTPRQPHFLSNGLVEFPLSTYSMGPLTLPALGGGYFRLYPLCLTRHMLRAIEGAGQPAMLYLHPYELGSTCPRLPGLGQVRRFRHYVHMDRTRERLANLFKGFAFDRIDAVLSARGLL